MSKKLLDYELRTSHSFFRHIAEGFTEEESGFTPHTGMFTIANQVSHVAQTVDWFVAGAVNPGGFDLNFEAHFQQMAKVQSLTEAMAWLDRAYAAASAWLATQSDADLESPLPPGMVMGNQPRKSVVFGIIDHTAHHRGALTVYARALGRVSPMPYEAGLPWEA